MTREELYQAWIIQEYDTRGIDREVFFDDLDKWYDSELKRNTAEMQEGLKDKTIRKQFIRLVWRFLKGESVESLEEEFGGEHD